MKSRRIGAPRAGFPSVVVFPIAIAAALVFTQSHAFAASDPPPAAASASGATPAVNESDEQAKASLQIHA
ncbi:MAG: hypothetical protein ABI421_06295, partial [Polyangiaceae bacterium]